MIAAAPLCLLGRGYPNWLRRVENDYPVETRVERAREIILRLEGDLIRAIETQMLFEVLAFGDYRSRNVMPADVKASAELVLGSLLEMSVLINARLWDAPDWNGISLSTVYWLTRTKEFRIRSVIRGRMPGQKFENLWGRIDRIAAGKRFTPKLEGLINQRNKRVGHVLFVTKRELEGPVLSADQGILRRALKRSVVASSLLRRLLINSDWDWRHIMERSKAKANGLSLVERLPSTG